jgi:hypothetical protein
MTWLYARRRTWGYWYPVNEHRVDQWHWEHFETVPVTAA